MSDGYQILNKNTPLVDPTALPAGSGSSGGYYNYAGTSKGPTGTSIGGGGTGSSNASNIGSSTGFRGAKGPVGTVGTVSLPNGTSVTIPYNGWYYNISISNPTPSAEKVKAEKKDDRDGCDCIKCKEFYPFAEPNQEDGTLICFSCRNGY